MKELSMAVNQFMVEQLGHYRNPHRVEFSMGASGIIVAGFIWPGEVTGSQYNLTVGYCTSSFDQFVEALNVATVTHLNEITPSFLVELFNQGLAEIECRNKRISNRRLAFLKQGNILWAIEGDNVEFEVTTPLSTPEQFVAYTKKRYSLNKKKVDQLQNF